MTPSSWKEPVADRAGRAYWDELWAGVVGEAAEFPDPLQLTHVERSFARLFDETFAGVPRRSRMLEIGCAHSIWLPYFASICQLTGLDYSEIGCAHTRAALERAGVEATIICGDAFAPPEGLEGSFDIVVSLGVVEHFEDTRATIEAFSAFLGVGGMLVTIVPNVRGSIGLLQRLLNPAVFRIHVPLTPADLRRAYTAAGLPPRKCEYFVSSNFGVLNLNGLDPRKLSTRAKRIVVMGLIGFSRLVGALDARVGLPAAGPLAGYVVCIGSKPG